MREERRLQSVKRVDYQLRIPMDQRVCGHCGTKKSKMYFVKKLQKYYELWYRSAVDRKTILCVICFSNEKYEHIIKPRRNLERVQRLMLKESQLDKNQLDVLVYLLRKYFRMIEPEKKYKLDCDIQMLIEDVERRLRTIK